MGQRDWNALVILRPARAELISEGPTEAESEIVGRHFHYYQKLVNDGVALLVGRTQDNSANTLGLAILKAADLESAWRIAEFDPAVREGVMTLEVRPYSIALFGDINS